MGGSVPPGVSRRPVRYTRGRGIPHPSAESRGRAERARQHPARQRSVREPRGHAQRRAVLQGGASQDLPGDGPPLPSQRADGSRHPHRRAAADGRARGGRQRPLPHRPGRRRADGRLRRELRPHRAREGGAARPDRRQRADHAAGLRPGRADRGRARSGRGDDLRGHDQPAQHSLPGDGRPGHRHLRLHQRAVHEPRPRHRAAHGLQGARRDDGGAAALEPQRARRAPEHGQDRLRADDRPERGPARGQDGGDLQPRDVGGAAGDAHALQRGAGRHEPRPQRSADRPRLPAARRHGRPPVRNAHLHRR